MNDKLRPDPMSVLLGRIESYADNRDSKALEFLKEVEKLRSKAMKVIGDAKESQEASNERDRFKWKKEINHWLQGIMRGAGHKPKLVTLGEYDMLKSLKVRVQEGFEPTNIFKKPAQGKGGSEADELWRNDFQKLVWINGKIATLFVKYDSKGIACDMVISIDSSED